MAIGKTTTIAARAVGWALCALTAAAILGCDVPPPVPTTADGRKVETVAVSPDEVEELAAVGNLLDCAARYRHALTVLRAYYSRIGALSKQIWAENELTNLAEARKWRYEGVPAPPAPKGESVAGAREVVLVERVIAARGDWQAALERLAELYARDGRNFRLALIRNVQQRFDPVRAYSYFLDAEVPPATLRPAEVVPQADAMFEKALTLHKQGKPLPGITDYDKQRRALMLFRRLVSEYPNSTKIAAAAFYIAEIYKEYFNEDLLAVHWYERVWQWDPHIRLPARFQAAVVYDLRLGQHAKAVQLYQEVIKHERFNLSNVRFATNRIRQLAGPEAE